MKAFSPGRKEPEKKTKKLFTKDQISGPMNLLQPDDEVSTFVVFYLDYANYLVAATILLERQTQVEKTSLYLFVRLNYQYCFFNYIGMGSPLTSERHAE